MQCNCSISYRRATMANRTQWQSIGATSHIPSSYHRPCRSTFYHSLHCCRLLNSL